MAIEGSAQGSRECNNAPGAAVHLQELPCALQTKFGIALPKSHVRGVNNAFFGAALNDRGNGWRNQILSFAKACFAGQLG
jgi:hypothetical protein